MSTVVNIHEAKTHLSRLLEKVGKGEEVVIARAGKPVPGNPCRETRAGKPVARLVAGTPAPPRRLPGSAKDTLWAADDFDEPLPEGIQKYFER